MYLASMGEFWERVLPPNAGGYIIRPLWPHFPSGQQHQRNIRFSIRASFGELNLLSHLAITCLKKYACMSKSMAYISWWEPGGLLFSHLTVRTSLLSGGKDLS